MPVSAIDETHATVPSPGGPATSFTPPLALTPTKGHVGCPDHRDLRSGYSTAPEFTATTGSPEQLTPIGGTASRSSAVRSNSSEFSAAGGALYDFYGGEQRKKLRHFSDDLTRIPYMPMSSGTRVTTTNSIGQNPRLWTGISPRPVCFDGDRVPILDLVDGSVHERTDEQGIFEEYKNNGCDVDAGFSVPMVEDQFELPPSTLTLTSSGSQLPITRELTNSKMILFSRTAFQNVQRIQPWKTQRRKVGK